MYIDIDTFAKALGIKPGEVIHAIRCGEKIRGVELPSHKKVLPGNRYMYHLSDVKEFIHKYNKRAG